MRDYSSDYVKINRRVNGVRHHEGSRLAWLDALRGLTVISMLFYHFMWDVVYLFGNSYSWFIGPLGYIWQQSICWSFIIISGFSFGLSKKPIIRGSLIVLCGALIMLVTGLLTPDIAIRFGVLTLLGTSMILSGILKPVIIKIPAILGLILSAGLFFITRDVNIGYLGFEGIHIMPLPDYLYSNIFTAFLGFPYTGFTSTDYFSIFPWIFLFLFGYYISKLYSDILYNPGEYEKPIFFIGRVGKCSLIIYILHQPIIYGVLYLIHMFI